MALNQIIQNLRAEFQRQLDEALARELAQAEISAEEKAELLKDLPNLEPPALTPEETKKAEKLIAELDSLLEKLADKTAEIYQLAGEYYQKQSELNGMLMNKKHNFNFYHTPGSLRNALSYIGSLFPGRAMNALLKFQAFPDKEQILKYFKGYRGI